jgi:hypothetical protein
VQFAASVKIIEKTDFSCLGRGCRKRGRKPNEFSALFARPLGDAYSRASVPGVRSGYAGTAYHTEYLSPFSQPF